MSRVLESRQPPHFRLCRCFGRAPHRGTSASARSLPAVPVSTRHHARSCPLFSSAHVMPNFPTTHAYRYRFQGVSSVRAFALQAGGRRFKIPSLPTILKTLSQCQFMTIDCGRSASVTYIYLVELSEQYTTSATRIRPSTVM